MAEENRAEYPADGEQPRAAGGGAQHVAPGRARRRLRLREDAGSVGHAHSTSASASAMGLPISKVAILANS